MDVTLRSEEGAKRAELITESGSRTGSKTIRLSTPAEDLPKLQESDDITIKKIVVRRSDSGAYAGLIDDYLLAGYDGWLRSAKYRTHDRHSYKIARKPHKRRVAQVTADTLTIHDHFSLVLNGPSDNLAAIMSGAESWPDKRDSLVESSRSEADRLRRRADRLARKADTLDGMDFETFADEHGGEFVLLD